MGIPFSVALVIAGIAVVGWGATTLFSGRPDALSQFILSAVLGCGLSVIGLFMLRRHFAENKKAAWLRQHGETITAVPVEIRTIKTDSVRRTESYCLVLEPIGPDRQRHGLDGVRFETDEIFARSVPDNYQNLKIEVVIDPECPREVHVVNFDTQDLWNAARQM